jgi:UTP--glucose-1-phosphate uridylyltransferase
MKIRKAIITAAGRGQRQLPLQVVVDRSGVQKPALQILLEETLSAGVEEVALVVCPGDQDAYRQAAGGLAGRVQFVEQGEPRGYGHAICCAREFSGNDPFLHLISDHLYVSADGKSCARQLVEVAEAEQCAVSAVQATRETMLPHYGTIGGRRVPRRDRLYDVESVVEKPTPTEAEQHLNIPGLRAGRYLCFFGMHVLTPLVMDILDQMVREQPDQPTQLSPALANLAGRERYLALEIAGHRYNIGVKYGLLAAQLALALDGVDREEVLAQLVELLALRRERHA